MKFINLFIILIKFSIIINAKSIDSRIKCNSSKLCPLKSNLKNTNISIKELEKEEYHQCCSSNGFCGETIEYCGLGCQSGDCLSKENINDVKLNNSFSSTTNASSAFKKRNLGGRCGRGYGSCSEGECCSVFGWCGNTKDHCSLIDGCQLRYGKCSNEGKVDRCGPGIGRCPAGECCSKHGWCGTTENYCSSSDGCQNDYGSCSDKRTVNKCGPGIGNCPPNECCSVYGWCGTSISHCAIANGCQPGFGACVGTNTDMNITPKINDRCGPGYGSCSSGRCCSRFGYCGDIDEFCDESKGCQSEYGECKKINNFRIY
jgi:hypothetical protein